MDFIVLIGLLSSLYKYQFQDIMEMGRLMFLELGSSLLYEFFASIHLGNQILWKSLCQDTGLSEPVGNYISEKIICLILDMYAVLGFQYIILHNWTINQPASELQKISLLFLQNQSLLAKITSLSAFHWRHFATESGGDDLVI